MTTFAQLLTVASGELGYAESGGSTGHDGNVTKYWAELDPPLEGQSWCAVFVSWCFRHAGAPLPVMDRPYGFMNVASARNYANAHGLLDQSGDYAPGDILLMGTSGSEHTGIVISDDGVSIRTIEGNSQQGTQNTNGGGVYLHTRRHGPWIYGAMRTAAILAAGRAPAAPSRTQTRTPPPVKTVPRFPGYNGSNRSGVAAIQQRLGNVVVDGDYGPITRNHVVLFQKAHHLTPDGIVGPITWRALWQ